MLAVGEAAKECFGTYHKEGYSIEAIADKLEATPEEVSSWIREEAEGEAACFRSRFEPDCAGCHQVIDINAVRMSIMGAVYHEKCGRKATFDPCAA